MGARIIVFDIDGIIATGTKEDVYSDAAGWDFSKCTLVPGIVETMLHFRNKGYTIVLNTSRWAQDLVTTENWLSEMEVPYDELWMGKPYAMLYVDDKAYRHRGPWTEKDILQMEKLLAGEEELDLTFFKGGNNNG